MLPNTSHSGGMRHKSANNTTRSRGPGMIQSSRDDSAGVNIAT